MRKDNNEELVEEKRMLRVADIQKIFDCSVKKAYEIVNQPDFPKIKIGRDLYIPVQEYDKWIKKYTGKEYKLV